MVEISVSASTAWMIQPMLVDSTEGIRRPELCNQSASRGCREPYRQLSARGCRSIVSSPYTWFTPSPPPNALISATLAANCCVLQLKHTALGSQRSGLRHHHIKVTDRALFVAGHRQVSRVLHSLCRRVLIVQPQRCPDGFATTPIASRWAPMALASWWFVVQG